MPEKYNFADHVIVQRYIDGAWRYLKTSDLTNPLEEHDWIRLHPLRVSIISHSRQKIGTAQNPQELLAILEAMNGGKLIIPYNVAKRQDREFTITKDPKGGSRNLAEIFSPETLKDDWDEMSPTKDVIIPEVKP